MALGFEFVDIDDVWFNLELMDAAHTTWENNLLANCVSTRVGVDASPDQFRRD
ncbi:hypothetical protein WG936_05205 [Corynebacterium sp. H127]|uniref:hypothetical protein n=1 Tax=Corynebacterium sp. H127 TaxID=3133418 RepID=UPI0030A26C4A